MPINIVSKEMGWEIMQKKNRKKNKGRIYWRGENVHVGNAWNIYVHDRIKHAKYSKA